MTHTCHRCSAEIPAGTVYRIWPFKYKIGCANCAIIVFGFGAMSATHNVLGKDGFLVTPKGQFIS